MNDSLNSQNQLALSGMPQDNSSDAASQSDLVSQVHKLAGQNTLAQLFQSGLLKHDDEPEADIAATALAHPDFSKKEKSPLSTAVSEKLSGRLSKFLEDLGSQPPPTDEKGLERLLSKAHNHLMKAPGFSKLKVADRGRITHRILKLITNGDTNDLHEIIEHDGKFGKSRDKVNAKIAALFGDSHENEAPIDDKERDRIKEYVDNNELIEHMQNEPTAMAEGGMVKKHPILSDRVATAYPQQASTLGAAKTRIHNYLNSMKPQKAMGLPFDKDLPNPQKDAVYHKAIDMAARPLSILDSVRDGSISPSNFSHFAKMHPELHDLLKKKITNEITNMQFGEDKHPPFKIKQALSLFMGSPMEQTMTQPAIQAAQATFIQKPQQQAQQEGPKGKSKGSPSKLKDKGPKAYQTPDQAAQMDRTVGRTE